MASERLRSMHGICVILSFVHANSLRGMPASVQSSGHFKTTNVCWGECKAACGCKACADQA